MVDKSKRSIGAAVEGWGAGWGGTYGRMRPNDLEGQKKTLELRVDALEERYGDRFGPYHTVGFRDAGGRSKRIGRPTTSNNARNNRKREDERGYEGDRRTEDDRETKSKRSDSWMTMHKTEGKRDTERRALEEKGEDRKR